MLTKARIIVKGSELSLIAQSQAKAGFIHRFTGDHRPHWASQPMPNGESYKVQFASDDDWLDNSLFAIRSDGHLDRRFHEHMSFPTWPLNPELREKFGCGLSYESFAVYTEGKRP